MKQFRSDLVPTLIERLARQRQPGGHADPACYDVLASPHRHSPFLTVAEWPEPRRQSLAAWVVKVLVVPEEDATCETWRGVLHSEEERWRQELQRRLALPASGGVSLLSLPLPSSVGSSGVQRGVLGPFRSTELFAEGAPATGGDVSFDLLVRPFIPWPRLSDVGFSREQMQQRWQQYCETHQLARHLRESKGLFDHFCDEALIHGADDLLLSSAWRLGKF